MLFYRKSSDYSFTLTIVRIFFVFLFSCFVVFLSWQQPARAQPVGLLNPDLIGFINAEAAAGQSAGQIAGTLGISVTDVEAVANTAGIQFGTTKGNWLASLIELGRQGLLKAGSQAFGAAVRTALNTFAYDAANQIASGMTGQQPAFEQRGFGDLFKDSLDAAAGDFLSTLGNEGFGGLNLCEPTLGIDLSIVLGLYQTRRPQVQCTFSQLRANWEQDLRNPNFLRNFQDYFEPTQNDLGISLSVQTMFLEKQANESLAKLEDYKLNRGWLDIRYISGDKATPAPLLEQSYYEDLIDKGEWAQYTGDALIDAVNIFLNQLAIQLLRNLLWGGLADDSGRSGVDLYNFEADRSAGGGIAAAREQFRKIIQPRFDARGDYNILAELTQCPDPNRAGHW